MTKTEKQELWDFINVLYRLPLKEKKGNLLYATRSKVY